MIRALACLVLLFSLAPWRANAVDLAAFWRQFFARPERPAPDAREQRRIALGRQLFADTRLSGDGARACASCHLPTASFTDGRARGAARDGGQLARNTPSLWNVGSGTRFYWDGRAGSLEEQASFPILDPREMAGDWNRIAAALKRDAALDVAFHQAFDERPAIQPATILAALAAYERSLVSPPTRFDRWIEGEATALTAMEIDGFRLFVGRAGCVACHAGWRFTDDKFHDIGLDSEDAGRGGVAGGIPGLRAFKTPPLREAAWSAPYMHDGSKRTLQEVVDHYAGGFTERPGLSSNLVRKLTLSAAERAQLVAFLKTLSSDTPPHPADETARR
jgi:cytochrome c peroxidase